MSLVSLTEWFCEMPLSEIEAITGIDGGNLSKIFRGNKKIGERTLIKASDSFNLAGYKITPGQLLDLILERRKIAQEFSKCGKNHTPNQYRRHRQKLFELHNKPLRTG